MANKPTPEKSGRFTKAAKSHPHGTKVTPRVLDKATEIVANTGIDKKAAIRVALGQTTVADVLKEMMVRDRVEKLTKKHGVSRDRAFAVTRNKLSLEEAILLHEMAECPEWQPEKSVLIDLLESGSQAVFRAYGEPDFNASVEKLTKFDCWLKRGDAPSKEYQKHDLLLVVEPDSVEELSRLQQTDEDVKTKGLGPSVTYKDRHRSRKRILFKHHRDELKTRVTLRDSTVLEGRVGWFGKWEFSLELSPTCRVVVFRHAMYRLEDITPKSAQPGRPKKKRDLAEAPTGEPSSPKTSDSPKKALKKDQPKPKKKKKKKKKKKRR